MKMNGWVKGGLLSAAGLALTWTGNWVLQFIGILLLVPAMVVYFALLYGSYDEFRKSYDDCRERNRE